MRPPKLHDRGPSQLVADAAALATVYTPDWSGVADPQDAGNGLIALAARLVELLAERVNRVPEKNLLAFLDLVGVERAPGLPAEAAVTFLLSSKSDTGQQIPAATQVATTQSEAADAQVFETRNAFFATPARLVNVLNLLPAGDLYGSLPPLPLPPTPADVADSGRAIDVLSAAGAGLLGVPHELYLASAALFARAEPTDIQLNFAVANPASLSVFGPGSLRWQRFDAQSKQWEDIERVSYPANGGSTAAVRFARFTGTDTSTVAGERDAWIVGRLIAPPSAVPELPLVSQLTGSVATAQAPPTAPDTALFNDTPLDLSRPAYPFSERPRYGDAFHLASAKAFGPDVETVTARLTLRGYTLAELQAIFGTVTAVTTITTVVEWQYLAAGSVWKTIRTVTHNLVVAAPPQTTLGAFGQQGAQATATQIEKDFALFGTLGAPADVSITFTPPADTAVGKVGGVSSRWIRAVLRTQAPYGRDGFVTFAGTPPQPRAVGPTFVPPIIEKIEITYRHKTSAIALDRITTENNFELVRFPPPFTFNPFVPLQLYAPTFEWALRQQVGGPGFLGGAPGLYLSFDRKFATGFISLLVAFVEPRDTAQRLPETGHPHVSWEYLAAGLLWKPLDIRDGTSELTSSGVVAFPAPADSVPLALFPTLTDARPLYWYRARLVSGSYTTPPRLTAVLLNTVMSDNRQTVRGDWVLASGSGDRNQQATVLRQPVLAGAVWVRENEMPSEADLRALVDELTERAIEEGATTLPTVDDVVEEQPVGVSDREVWVRWLRVANFHVSGPRSRHYTLEAPSGVVTFGDGEHGLIPPVGKDNIVVRGLSSGGGEVANQAATPLAIKELKTSLPFVGSVFNLEGATGGADPWSIEQTINLGPQAIKNLGRAVTTEDYAWITLATFSQVARAKCLATQKPDPNTPGKLMFMPGAVSVIVVPKSADSAPQPTRGLLRRIEAFLGGRALGAVASTIYALPPQYLPVAIAASVHPQRPEEASVVAGRVVRALEAFFHPLTGGEQGDGWAFGRSVYLSEVFAVIQRTDGVGYVASATFVEKPESTRIPVEANALVASGIHQIAIV